MYNDIPVGLRVPSNLPLDAKLWAKSRVELESLGTDNNLAYTYYKGLRIYCADEKEIYEWMPVTEGGTLPKLLDDDFTYPAGYVVNGVNYAGVAYNLFKIPQAWDTDVLGIENIGDGSGVWKELSGSTHKLRSISSEVVQLDTEDNQITGEITTETVIEDDTIKIKFDFSDVKVPLQQVGIPEYYVHFAADASVADGSIVRPYKTWEACKTAIGGTADTSRNIRVIFLSNITSNQDLTLNGIEFVFQNGVTFNYSGVGAVIDYSKFTGTDFKQISLSGNGIIQQDPNSTTSTTLNSLNIIGGDGTFSRTLRIKGKIEIRERTRNEKPASDPINFTPVDRLDGGDKILYGYNESFIKGTVYISGRNTGGTSLLHIEQDAVFIIRDRINVAIQMKGTGEGSSALLVDGTLQVLRIGNYLRYSSISTDGSSQTYLEPSTTVPRILIEDGYDIIMNSGTFKASFSGSSNSGGYKCLIEVKGKSIAGKESRFAVRNDGKFIVSSDVYYKYLFNVDGDSNIDIDNINTNITSYNNTCQLLSYFYAATSAMPSIKLVFGRIDFSGAGTFKNANISTIPTTYWVFVNGAPVSSSMKTSANTGLDNDIYTDSGVLTRD